MREVSAALSLLLALGCGTFVESTPLNAPPRPMIPREPESVEVYSSSAPTRPHVDVALLEVTQTDSFNEQSAALMLRRLREKAGEMGCDAVFISGRSERDGEPLDSDFALLDPGSRSLHATCMVYTGAVPPSEQLANSPPLPPSEPADR